ncbi:MAG TPA: SpoIIE family protein phosphatase, partial [Terriglobia bacterium]|nr:SpoIIE family protein phosphatase [Terriglobia bacterium]
MKLESLIREYRAHRLARITCWALIYGVVLELDRLIVGRAPGILWLVFWIAVIPGVIYYVFCIGKLVKHWLLWGLRQRLIVTYVFIAFVPVILILALAGLGAFILYGQFAAFLVSQHLDNHVDELVQLNRVVAHEAFHSSATSPGALLDELHKFYIADLSEYSSSYPGLEVTIYAANQERSFELTGKDLKTPVPVPAWLKEQGKEEFEAVVESAHGIFLRAVDQEKTQVGDLTIILSLPVTPSLLDMAGAGIGPVSVFTFGRTAPKQKPPATRGSVQLETSEGNFLSQGSIRSANVQIPQAHGILDMSVFGVSALDAVDWSQARARTDSPPILVLVYSRTTALNTRLLATLGSLSSLPVTLFVFVALVLLVIELVALVIGVKLTRSITTTVDKLHDATEKVKSGDFSHRINLPARDQLSSLGVAFDSMTAAVERLLEESKEKSRLESELQIAREVQNQLFPQTLPELPGLRVFGVCHAARVVSGDYYDFLKIEQESLALVLGDISGKGISAALLMAAVQSSIRAQFFDGNAPGGTGPTSPLLPSEVVARLNRQLYQSTPPEKYATFFYAVYDDARRTLTYTNAGHPAPMLFRNGSVQRLEEGGTVVGLFERVKYDQAVVQLQPGDLILAFTDGMTEPENSFGEEFGEDRLVEAARRALHSTPDILAQEIYRSVNEWTGSPELQD